jgi:uncharacterized protein YjiS (DUF1127 family)
MLSLVQRRPQLAEGLWDQLRRVCRGARMAAIAWSARARQRDALSQLNDHLLADIGLTREAQRAECSKPFWCP